MKTFVRYIVKNNKKRGCIIGIVDEDNYGVGWSLYNKKVERNNGIPFKKSIAREIAYGRAFKILKKGERYYTRFPQSLQNQITDMILVCKKYISKSKKNRSEI